jgi:hypothetical protein
VTYLLWVKGGFEQLQEGDRVFVKVSVEREVSTATTAEVDDDDLTDDENEHDASVTKSSSMTSRMFVEYRGEITVARSLIYSVSCFSALTLLLFKIERFV